MGGPPPVRLRWHAMSNDTRSSRRASERRRKRVVAAGVAAGVAGVALVTAGAIAYWPDSGSPVQTLAPEPRVGRPGSASTGTPTADDRAAVVVTPAPSATRALGSIASGTSDRSTATPVAQPTRDPASSAPASSAPASSAPPSTAPTPTPPSRAAQAAPA